jgi:CYTH domain-containing protein
MKNGEKKSMSEVVNEEIEKKYLLRESNNDFTTPNFFSQFNSLNSLSDLIKYEGVLIKQAYIEPSQGIELAKKYGQKVNFEVAESRVRQKGNKYLLTLKSKGMQKRKEQEISISQETFENIYSIFEFKRVEKKRLEKVIKGLTYEFDYYLNQKLIVVEIEIKNESELVRIISLGKDVTFDKNYKNVNLAK